MTSEQARRKREDRRQHRLTPETSISFPFHFRETEPEPPINRAELEASGQLALPGFEEYVRPERQPYQWQPKPHILWRVKSYFQGYEAHGRTIRAGRAHIAGKLGISIRTLSRYIAVLVGQNWIATIRRTARAAVRKVLGLCGLGSDPGTSLGTPIEVKPEASIKLQRRTEPPSPSVVFLSLWRRWTRPTRETETEKQDYQRWREQTARELGIPLE